MGYQRRVHGVFIRIFFFPQIYWLINSQISKSFLKIILFLKKELMSIFGRLVLPGNIFIYTRIFFFIIFSNFIGLFPYIFTSTRHIRFTLTIALPLWLGRIIISIIFQYNNLFAHLVPKGTPGFLIPVIVIIETVSNIIRPLTLSIRSAANIVAGHLLLTLLGSQISNISFTTFLFFVFIIIIRSSCGLHSILRIYNFKFIIFK